MAERSIIRRRGYFSQGKTVPLRLHSESDASKHKPILSPIKLKTQNSKYIKTTFNHLPISQQSAMNVIQILGKGKQLFSSSKFDEVIPILKPLLNTSKQTQALYYIGCSLFYKRKYEYSIYYLNLLVQKQPYFNCNSFIILAAAYKQLNLFKPAIRIMNRCLDNHKHYEQGVIYLSKLYMKIRDFNSALSLLEQQIKRNVSMYLRLTYSDCLRLCGRIYDSLQQYTRICKNGELNLIGVLKRMTAYYELGQYNSSLSDCNYLIENQVESSQVYYFKGMNLLKLNINEQFPVEFSKSLDLNTNQLAVTNSLCEIIKYHIYRKDIYSAQQEIKRSKHLNIRDSEIKCLKLFVEGAIDCVKKRPNDAVNKLIQVQKILRSKIFSYSAIIQENLSVYLAYAYFLSSQYSKALKYYTMIGTNISLSTQYNKLICEAISHHQHNDFSRCTAKIQIAKSLICRFQSYFYLSINYVQNYFQNNQIQYLEKALLQLEAGTQHNPYSLFYFYYTLVLIQAKKPADAMISIAIQKSDDNIADYYFIKGVVQAKNDLSEALNAFTTAIGMLHIPTYYKQRSKCLYQLGMYNLAIQDLLKILTSQKDQEASILLAFNYYANEEYQLALSTIQQIFIQQNNHYLLGLKICLHIHLQNYQKAGTLGQIISSMETHTKILDQTILNKFSAILEQKCAIGQYDEVELLCLGGVYHFIHQSYDKSQSCFFESLTELKQQLTTNKNTSIDFGIQAKIYQSKFNTALTHIMLKEYQDASKLLQVLIQQTESQDTVEELKKLFNFLKIQMDSTQSMSINAQEKIIDIFPNYKLLSQKFPSSKIRFKNAVLVIKPILFYPQKIKFNIFPQLNPRFLKQFGIWKVQNAPQPPWVMREGTSFKFTTNMDINCPLIEYTQTNYEPQSSIDNTGRKDTQLITKQQLKLPDKVSEKLSKMIKNKSSY